MHLLKYTQLWFARIGRYYSIQNTYYTKQRKRKRRVNNKIPLNINTRLGNPIWCEQEREKNVMEFSEGL